MVRRLALAVLALALAVVAPAAAAPPNPGVLVPGKSLGGVRLGATGAQVEAAWGRAYGRCTNCRHTTWYFNFFAFQPRGAGIEFRGGRAVALYTIHQPLGWSTPSGLSLGEPVSRVRALYPRLSRRVCDGYDALILRREDTVSSFYVLDERLWGFGLSRRGLPICR
jgi:hypothetical protein